MSGISEAISKKSSIAADTLMQAAEIVKRCLHDNDGSNRPTAADYAKRYPEITQALVLAEIQHAAASQMETGIHRLAAAVESVAFEIQTLRESVGIDLERLSDAVRKVGHE